MVKVMLPHPGSIKKNFKQLNSYLARLVRAFYMTKLCKDCKYSNKHGLAYYCEHPSVGYSHVDGEPNAVSCIVARAQRNYVDTCGPQGKYFDPKPQKPSKCWFAKLSFLRQPPKPIT